MGLPFSPGSTPWLLANELRLSFRGTLGAKGGVRRYVILAVIMGAGASWAACPWPWACSTPKCAQRRSST